MGKIVKTVLVVVAVVAVVVFAPQIALAVGYVASGLGVALSAAAMSFLTSAIVGAAISFGLSTVASAFRKTPSLSNSLIERLQTSCVPTAPRKIVFGTTAAGNDVRFFETWGSKKDQYCQAIALASHKVSAIKSWYIENDVAWNGSVVRPKGITSFRAVTEGNPSNGAAMGSGTYWTNAATFDGCAYIQVAYRLSNEDWPSGLPSNTKTIVDGCPVYDPRRDGTKGGSGSHRWNDQNTWAFTADGVEIGRNPALALLTYLIGWRINGSVVWGMGIPIDAIDLSNFALYANLCDERVALQAGGTVTRYQFDGILSTADPHEACIGAITAAMGSCKMIDRGGTYSIVGGYDDTMGPVVRFTRDDLVGPEGAAQPYVFSPSNPARDSFNIVRGRFADPKNLYQLNDWGEPIVIDPLADGIPRTMTLDLGGVSRAETCQRIAKQFLLREAKATGTFAATFGPRAFQAQVGSLVSLSLPSEGWNNKLFRVVEQTEVLDLYFQMTLREESSEIYAWDREEKPLPANIRPGGYNPNDTLTPQGVTIVSSTYGV